MDFLIGIDIGTSSIKGVLISVSGKIEACKTKKHNYYTHNGFKVLDADEFCDSCFDVIKGLNERLSLNDKVIGLCASGASGNLMLCKGGKAITPVYGWQNNFDEEITEKNLSGLSRDDVYETVGWPKLKSFPLTALSYLKQTDAKTLYSADMICMHIEYLNFKLTGQWGITSSMGTPFYLIDQEKAEYKKEYLDLLNIKEENLPPIKNVCSVLGGISKEASEKTGLEIATPVILGTFDHPSAARGAGVFEENEILISCGTSWVVFIPYQTREKPQSKKILTDPFMHPYGNWCGMKSMASGSNTIDKYTKKYLGDISYEEFDALSEKSLYGANGLVINGEDTDVLGFDRSDIARAIMESIARGLKEFLEVLDAQDAKVIKLVGGITNSKVWCEVISEITKKKVLVVNGEHAGAVGSAMMAGVGAGVYKNEKEAFKIINK